MKIALRLFILLSVLFLGCKEKSQEDTEAGDAVESSENQVLYEEVMKVHDEVMPKMDDIYRKKEELKNKIANTPDMLEEEKKEIDARVAKLDSASEGMMHWMHQFNPIPDSVGEEKAREYLENEMEKIKKVKEDILQALKEADEN
jgi:hypothetical protein